jgi:hypothetical protein
MIVVVQGTKSFDDYSVFLTAMRSALIQINPDDKEFTVLSAGPLKINEMVMEFVNVSERSLKLKGIKARHAKIHPEWVIHNYAEIDFYAYLCKPKEELGTIVKDAQNKDVNVQVYRQF